MVVASTDMPPTSGEIDVAEPAPAEFEPGFFASLFKPLIQRYDTPGAIEEGPGAGVSEMKDDWAESIFGDDSPGLIRKSP